MKIVSVESTWFCDEYQLVAKLEDGNEEFLFGYSPVEYNFPVKALVGMTVDEAFELKNKMDCEYFKRRHHW